MYYLTKNAYHFDVISSLSSYEVVTMTTPYAVSDETFNTTTNPFPVYLPQGIHKIHL